MGSQLLVALFGDPSAFDGAILAKWWGESETWARVLGTAPNEIAGSFKCKPKGLTGNKGYPLVRYRAHFEKELAAENVECLALTRLARNWRMKAYDWEFETQFAYHETRAITLYTGVGVDCLRDASTHSPLAFAEEASDRGAGYFLCKYGFAVVMPRDFMVTGYISGLASDALPEEMVYDANQWSSFSDGEPGQSACGRSLRNVYGYNVLNAKHLEIRVGGQPLQNWIKARRGRGRIEPWGEGLFLWTFQEGDDQGEFLRWDYPPVVRAREELKKHSIFPWQRFVSGE